MSSQPEYDKQPVSWFLNEFNRGRLDLEPEIQRRSVWKPKKRMLLIDTIARSLPIGIITLYQTTRRGIPHYDVIDGKQRLEAIFGFMGAMGEIHKFMVDPVAITDDNSSPEALSVGRSSAAKVAGKSWEKLAENPKERILGYTIPVTIVKGKRIVAVESFTRMNAKAYTLSPQEVRHAVFKNAPFMNTVETLCEDITKHCNKHLPEKPADKKRSLERTSGFFAMGAISKVGLERMDDHQIASELLHLQIDGTQYARKDLSAAYTTYGEPNKAKARERGAKKLLVSLKRVWAIIDHEKLQDINCMRQKDEFLYALVGALRSYPISGGLTHEPFKGAVSDIRMTLSAFMADVSKYGDKGSNKKAFAKLVADYGDSAMGQRNSKTNRDKRVKTLKLLLKEVVPMTGPPFSSATRMSIWVNSTNKECAKCKKKVTWDDFDASHKKAKSLGGLPVVENGRVEHFGCNRSSGAR